MLNPIWISIWPIESIVSKHIGSLSHMYNLHLKMYLYYWLILNRVQIIKINCAFGRKRDAEQGINSFTQWSIHACQEINTEDDQIEVLRTHITCHVMLGKFRHMNKCRLSNSKNEWFSRCFIVTKSHSAIKKNKHHEIDRFLYALAIMYQTKTNTASNLKMRKEADSLFLL